MTRLRIRAYAEFDTSTTLVRENVSVGITLIGTPSAVRASGWSGQRIAAFREEATAGDYDHLLRVVMERLDVM